MKYLYYSILIFSIIAGILLLLPGRKFEYAAPPATIQQTKAESAIERTVTAYTLRPEETDDTPCIGAYGDDLCEISKSVQVCASNEFGRGTKLKVGDVECIVLDRMSPRFKNRVDLVINNLGEALQFGRQTLEVAVISQ